MPDGYDKSRPSRDIALVLAGGIALGAFEGGAYAALHESEGRLLRWVAGSSIGAIMAAIIAGNAPKDRVSRLQQFWQSAATDPLPWTSFWFGSPQPGLWRQTYNQLSALQTMFLGKPGIFRPRLFPGERAGANDVSALYDLAPLRSRLLSLVDFDRLNCGEVRVSFAATDIITGERVTFDSSRGVQIKPEHVMASCALLPLFAPIEIEGRLLGDGGLASNAPLDLVLQDPSSQDMLCIVVDLFARKGSRPHTLGASISRASDIAFGNQSYNLLDGQAREHHLRAMIARLAARLPSELRSDPEIAEILAEGREHQGPVLYLDYRAAIDEAGPIKPFDFSRATLSDRWKAGEEAMRAALWKMPSVDHQPAKDLQIEHASTLPV